MPSINAIKKYKINSYYHLYNRAHSKNTIFNNAEDYIFFVSILKKYLTPKVKVKINNEFFEIDNPKSMHRNIDLIAFCIMPNHFHLLVKQKNEKDISKFVKRISISYCLYYRKKYKHSGYLFQGRFKGVLLRTEKAISKTFDYVHKNPTKAKLAKKEENYRWSSSRHYAGKQRFSFIKSEGRTLLGATFKVSFRQQLSKSQN